nr:HIRAN domain-containing protein [Endozoicomonas sp. SESOKO3]
MDFFVHGVRYVSESARQRIKALKEGDKLLLMNDFQNETAPLALAIRTTGTPEIIGFCPRFLAHGLADLAADRHSELSLTVARVNQEAPLYYQLMCELKACSSQTRNLFNSQEFQTISGSIH